MTTNLMTYPSTWLLAPLADGEEKVSCPGCGNRTCRDEIEPAVCGRARHCEGCDRRHVRGCADCKAILGGGR